MRRGRLACAAVVLGACGQETRPLDREVPYNTVVALDGEEVPGRLEGEWRLLERPDGSGANLIDGERFFADLPGDYLVSLVNGVETSAAELVRLKFTAVNYPPVIDVERYGEASAFEPLMLDARGTTDPNGDPFTLRWQLSEQPAAGGAELTSEDATAVLVPRTEGYHEVEVVARDALGAESRQTVGIEVATGYRVIDTGWGENAGYSESHDAVLVFGTEVIAVYQVATRALETVAGDGTFAALSPDGLHFAIPRPGWAELDIYTVVPLELLRTVRFRDGMQSWILRDRHVYYSTYATTVRRVSLATGADQLVGGGDGELFASIDPDHFYRRQVSGTVLRYDIGADPPVLEGEVEPETTSFYWALGFEDRPRFVVGRDVARFSPDLASDLDVVDQMPDFVRTGDHSAERGQIAASYSSDYSPTIRLIDDESLAVVGEVMAPEFGSNQGLPARVFFDAAGEQLVILAPEPLTHDPGIAVVPLPPP